MSDPLYSKEVLRLAAEAGSAGHLKEPDCSHTEYNQACGDRTTVDLKIENGRVEAMAHDTKACVLAQASATILAHGLIGCTLPGLEKLKAEVTNMLQCDAPPPEQFASYAGLREAANYPNRHKCVLLPIEAALKAFAACTRNTG